jgi:WhiB family redox-sensing transcriptional regulator
MMHANEHPRPDPHEWRNDAACRGMDTAIFYPPKGGESAGQVRVAKAVCARCPVSDDCLADAMAPPFELQGIRGGMTGEDRRNLRRRLQRAARREATA